MRNFPSGCRSLLILHWLVFLPWLQMHFSFGSQLTDHINAVGLQLQMQNFLFSILISVACLKSFVVQWHINFWMSSLDVSWKNLIHFISVPEIRFLTLGPMNFVTWAMGFGPLKSQWHKTPRTKEDVYTVDIHICRSHLRSNYSQWRETKTFTNLLIWPVLQDQIKTREITTLTNRLRWTLSLLRWILLFTASY